MPESTSEAKPCIRCGEVKPLDEFYRRARRSEKRSSTCKACVLDRQRARRPVKPLAPTPIDTGERQTCIECRESKQPHEFYRRRDSGKLKGQCRSCVSKRQRSYHENGPQKYGRYQKYDQPDGRRQCRICDEVKLLEEFRPRKADGTTRRNECWDCFREAQKARYHADTDVHRDRMRKANYGLAPGDYARMHAEQGGVCAICGEPETSSTGPAGKVRGLFVDHHHGTGQVRDLLCMRCNMGIGQFRDDPDLLLKAASYLNRHHAI